MSDASPAAPARTSGRWAWVAASIVALVAIAHTASTPMVADDYFWAVLARAGIGDAWHEAWHHYNVQTGRILPHLMLFVFSWLPRPAFVVVNGLITGAFALGAARLVAGERRPSAGVVAAFAVALWWALPAYGQDMVWLAGAVNYLWVCALMVWVLAGVRRLLDAGRAPGAAALVGLAGGGLIVGMSSETAGPVTLLVVLLLVAFGRQIRLWNVLVAAAIVVGLAIQFLSPGNRARGAVGWQYLPTDSGGKLDKAVGQVVRLCEPVITTPLGAVMVAAVVLTVWGWRLHGFSPAVRTAAALALGGFAGWGMLVAAPMFPLRSLLTATTLLLVAAGQAGRLVLAGRGERVAPLLGSLLAAAVALSAVAAVLSIGRSAEVSLVNQRRIESARAQGPGADVVADPLTCTDSHLACWGLTDWPDYGVAEWLGVRSVRVR